MITKDRKEDTENKQNLGMRAPDGGRGWRYLVAECHEGSDDKNGGLHSMMEKGENTREGGGIRKECFYSNE